MWISAATPGGSGGTELWINTSICDHARAVVSIRDPQACGRADLWYMHTSAFYMTVLRRAEEWWDSTGSILRTVFRPTWDRVVMINANGGLE